MSVLRQDPTTEDWVVIAEERARRPSDFRQTEARPARSQFDAGCPFCVGNEDQTPVETLRYVNADGTWQVRVVPNKYAALTGDGATERRTAGDLFHWMDGYGDHEVIIESPRHDIQLADMDEEHISLILRAYQERYNTLKTNPKLRFITIFRNYGESAGTSLLHPHSQLIATPVAPQDVRQKLEVATRFFDDAGMCLYCALKNVDVAAGDRVILKTDDFVVVHPYASRSPFETWIVPLSEHSPSFGLFPAAKIGALANVLKTVLRGLRDGLNDPDYNYAIYTATTEDEDIPYYDWHIRIIPRLTIPAGFEMGSGMSINVAMPEHTAAFMREIISQPAQTA